MIVPPCDRCPRKRSVMVAEIHLAAAGSEAHQAGHGHAGDIRRTVAGCLVVTGAGLAAGSPANVRREADTFDQGCGAFDYAGGEAKAGRHADEERYGRQASILPMQQSAEQADSRVDDARSGSHRCLVSSGSDHQLLSRPLKYLRGASISSAGSALSSVATWIETYSPPISGMLPRPNGRTPQCLQNM